MSFVHPDIHTHTTSTGEAIDQTTPLNCYLIFSYLFWFGKYFYPVPPFGHHCCCHNTSTRSTTELSLQSLLGNLRHYLTRLPRVLPDSLAQVVLWKPLRTWVWRCTRHARLHGFWILEGKPLHLKSDEWAVYQLFNTKTQIYIKWSQVRK